MSRIRKKVREYIDGFPERQAARDRLPSWAKLAQFAIWVPSWLFLLSLWVATFLVLRQILHPAEGWRHFNSTGMGIITFAAMFGTVPLGLIATNVFLWIIPPLRRANELAGEGVPGMSFREAIGGLLKLSYYLVPICVLAAFAGALKP